MKRLISLLLFLMMVLIVIGCAATMTSEERKEKYDLRTDYGNKPFIGSASRDDMKWIGTASNF